MSRRFLATGLAALFVTSLALGNAAPIARPVTTNTAEAKLVVQVDPAATKPVLKVPAALVGAKAPQPKPGGQALLDNPMLLLAGLALAGAFVSGGFWFLRGKAGRAVALFLGIVTLALVGGALFADLAIPPRPMPQPPLVLPANVNLSGDITVEVYTHQFDNRVYLIVPAQKAPEKAPSTPEPKPE